jgi:hypothetical protein
MFRTHKYATASIVAAFAVILGLALPAVGEHGVPFKGHADALVTDVELELDGAHYTLATTGQATHLGRFTGELSIVLQLDGTFEGEQVLVAANGDKVFADVEGAFISAIDFVATYTITGGTGRFRNASGAAQLVGVSPDATHASFTFDGTISY